MNTDDRERFFQIEMKVEKIKDKNNPIVKDMVFLIGAIHELFVENESARKNITDADTKGELL